MPSPKGLANTWQLYAKGIIFAIQYEISEFSHTGTFFGIWICAFRGIYVCLVPIGGTSVFFRKDKRWKYYLQAMPFLVRLRNAFMGHISYELL